MQPPLTLCNRVSLTLFTCVLLGLTANLSDGRQTRAYEEISQTMDVLFRDYDKNIAPQIHYLQPIMVSLKVTLDHVFSFDPAEQSLHSLLTLETNWSDRRLAWYPTKQRSFRLHNMLVWEPSFYFTNSISAMQPTTERVIRLEYNGNLNRYQKISLKTFCPIKRYHNRFSCPLMLKAYPFPSTQERLRVTEFEVSENFMNHLWNVEVNTNATRIYNHDPLLLVIDLNMK